MRKFIILVCFFSVVGLAFALPITLSYSSPSPNLTVSSNKVDYDGTIEHLFTHCLLAYPTLALSSENPLKDTYNNNCLTPSEFKEILNQLYENNYALIDINKIFEEKNGKVVKSKLRIPEGKKPFVLSFDDAVYDEKKAKHGMVDKIIVGNDGELASQTEITWGLTPTTDISKENEFIPILEHFVKEHPDFSIDGAKGTICLTGFDGILGYRTSDINTTNRQQEINSAKIVVEKLKEKGWNFACHSFGHYHMKSISLEKFKEEILQWKEQVEPIIGKTQIYVYPYGEWELENEDGTISEKHKLLLENGFKLFCGVGINPFFSNLPYNSSFKTLFMDRTPLDGFTLKNREKELSRLFNASEVYDLKNRKK